MFPSGSAAAAAAPSRPAAVARVQERFTLTANVATARKERVRGRGVLSAIGTAYPGQRPHRTWLVFKRGSVRMVTAQDSASVSVPNPATCKFTEVFRGTYQLRGGSHRYARATGSGSYETKLWGQLTRKKGSCTATLASVRQTTWTSGSMRW
jgi:hypothetical protein